MPDPISVTLSVISLGATGWLAYETELRRARMSIELLGPPKQWDVSAARPSSVRGVLMMANISDAQEIVFAGSCPATIGNEGPKGGAVWDVRAEVQGLDKPWQFNPNILDRQPYTLSGKTYDGWQPRFSLTCKLGELTEGLQTLQEGENPVRFMVLYKRRNRFGRPGQAITTLVVPRKTILAAVKDGAARQGLDLSQAQIVKQVQEMTEAAFQRWHLNQPEIDNLIAWVWMQISDGDVTYAIEGDDPSSRLLSKPGWGGMTVIADGHRSTLEEIAETHRKLVGEVAALYESHRI